jgi:uncharacterized protein YukE
MRICNLSDGLGQLTHALAELNQKWAETQLHWNDHASDEFENDFVRPIQPQMQALMAAVQTLAGTVETASGELSDRGDE